MKRKVFFGMTVISLLAGISVVSLPLIYAHEASPVLYSDSNMTNVIEHKKTDYKTNENGQTYGTSLDAMYVEDLPDLIAVIGDNGIKGYVYNQELMAGPSNPEEAMKYQEALENGKYIPKVYTVYESDGKTIIDTFTETIPDQYLK